MPIEDGGGDVGCEVGEAEELAEVRAVEPLRLRQVAELATLLLDQHVVETVGADDQPDQRPVRFREWRERIGALDHHTDFLARAAQPHRMRQRQGRLIIDRVRIGDGEAIIEKGGQPARAEMDDHLVGTNIDALNQGEEDDTYPEWRHCSPLAGKLGGTSDPALLQQRLAGLNLRNFEEARGLRKQPPDAVDDDLLDLRGRDAQPCGGFAARPDNQRAGDIIAVAPALLDRMGRGHALALAVEQQPGKQARVLDPSAGAALDRVLGKTGLRGIPQRSIDDRAVLARIGLILVDDLPAIEPVLEDQVERAAADWLAAPAPSRCAGPGLTGNAISFEFGLQQPDRAERGIATE